MAATPTPTPTNTPTPTPTPTLGPGVLITGTRADENPVLAGLGSSLLTSLIETASELLENWCNRQFVEADYDDFYDGEHTREILVDNFPLTTLTAVTIIDTDDTEHVIDTDDLLVYETEGRIKFKSIVENSDYDYFPRGDQNVEVEYTAGFATVPAPIEEAVVQLALYLYNTGQVDTTLTGEKIGDYSYTRANSSAAEGRSFQMPEIVKVLAGRYRNRQP